MLIKNTKVKIIDNSGCRRCTIFNLKSKRAHIGVGDICVASVKKVKNRNKVQKGDVVTLLVLRTKYPYKRICGTRIQFIHNEAILINKELSPIGTKIKGPIPKEIRINKWLKVMSTVRYII